MPVIPLFLSPEEYQCSNSILHTGWNLSHGSERRFLLRWCLTGESRYHVVPFGRGDHVVAAALLHAMSLSKPLHCHGQVSPTLLAGIEDLQRIWCRWRPERYHMIPVSADEEVELKSHSGHGRGLFTMSGGVDGTFSLYRHLFGEPGRLTISPRGVLLVHGFDVPLENEVAFQSVITNVEAMLDRTAIPVYTVSTNFRDLRQSWGDANGLGLASCLLLFQGAFDVGVVGSGAPYESLTYPWGSTVVTDPLIRTEAFRIRLDGAEYDRTEKVAWLARNTWPGVVNRLRVCWEGEIKDRNCGSCEKCLRTALNFWAAGVSAQAPRPLHKVSLSVLRRVRVGSAVAELERAQRHALKRYPKGDPVMKGLQRAISRAHRRLKVKRLLGRRPFLYRTLLGSRHTIGTLRRYVRAQLTVE